MYCGTTKKLALEQSRWNSHAGTLSKNALEHPIWISHSHYAGTATPEQPLWNSHAGTVTLEQPQNSALEQPKRVCSFFRCGCSSALFLAEVGMAVQLLAVPAL